MVIWLKQYVQDVKQFVAHVQDVTQKTIRMGFVQSVKMS